MDLVVLIDYELGKKLGHKANMDCDMEYNRPGG